MPVRPRRPPNAVSPPQSFILCNVCHHRLHLRFPDSTTGKPSDWNLFLLHLRRGGYGCEFTALHSREMRLMLQADLEAGKTIHLPHLRARNLTGHEWWQMLTLDPESLIAPWARPRPWIERPSAAIYQAGLEQIKPTDVEIRLLEFHANLPRRCATMRDFSEKVLSSDSPSSTNLIYGGLAHRLAHAMGWIPESREDGTPSWMTAVAEGWQPDGREFEWVMVISLASLFRRSNNWAASTT